MASDDWVITTWNNAVPGARMFWTAKNTKTGQCIEASNRRELYAAIKFAEARGILQDTGDINND